MKSIRILVALSVLALAHCPELSSDPATTEDSGGGSGDVALQADEAGGAEDLKSSDDGASPETEDAGPTSPGPNILLVIADDFGVDAFAPYATAGDGRTYAPTPNLDALCQAGVRFANAWSAPTCTPTRGTILTGRYGFRTGLLTAGGGNNIALDETTLPQLLTEYAPNYRHANIGKWHLGTTPLLGGASAPNTMGWQHYSGALSGALEAYEQWDKTTDGVTAPSGVYATTQNVDEALAFIAAGPSDRPWLVWLAFNAPHRPFHLPPDQLHTQQSLSGSAADLQQRPEAYYRAMVEAMDTEVGRLLASVDLANTRIIFVGDNGTPGGVIEPPWSPMRAKDTLYQGGIHVPLCIAGPGVDEGRIEPALVHTVDIFGTIAQWAGVPLEAMAVGEDSRSVSDLVKPGASDAPRDWNFSEFVEGRTIRDARYKLIVRDDGTEELYDLQSDPLELADRRAEVLTDPELDGHYLQLKQWLSALVD